MIMAKHWIPIVDKYKAKLSSCKANNLSFGGHLTFVKFVFGSLPVYYFSLFMAPKKIIDFLERI